MITRRLSDHASGAGHTAAEGRPIVTADVAATIASISQVFAYAAVRRGEIPFRWIGGRVLVPRVAGIVNRFEAECASPVEDADLCPASAAFDSTI